MRQLARVVVALGLVVCMALAPAGAQTAPPSVPPADDIFCPVRPFIAEPLQRDGTRWLVGLETHVLPGAASGTIALYDGNRRYDIPFHHVTVANFLDTTVKPTPIVVSFPERVHIDAAVIVALGDPPEPCPERYEPYPMETTGPPDSSPFPFDPYPGARQTLSEFHRAAASATSIAAPAAVDEPLPHSCSQPSIPATTVSVPSLDYPPLALVRGVNAGAVAVLVTLDPADHIVATRVERTSDHVFDATALSAARQSRFRTQTFRCRKVYASYLFYVTYSPR